MARAGLVRTAWTTVLTTFVAAAVAVASVASVAAACGDHGRHPRMRDVRAEDEPIAASPERHRAILPYAARNDTWAPGPPRVWGTQFSMEFDAAEHALDVSVDLPRLAAAGIGGLRTNLYWRDVEPVNTTPDRFDWSRYDDRLAAYARDGRDVVVSIVAYPKWAMVYGCGFGYTTPEMADEWRSFVRAAAERYREAPYRIAAWEIGNEIDGKTTVTADDRKRPPDWGGDEPAAQTGGCWGNRVAEYVDFLRVAHEEVKRAAPGTRVTFGNLAYADVEERFHMDFLDRFLELGGGRYIDYAGYHWFPDVQAAFPTEPLGPDLFYRFRATLRRHGVGVPIWITETNRGTNEGSNALDARQVTFLTQLLPRVLAAGDVERIYWYAWGDFPGQVPGFWQRGVIRADRTPKPALYALPTVRHFTNGRGTVVRDDDIVVLAFQVPRALDRHVIAWSPDGRSRTLDLPAAPGETATITTLPMEMLTAGTCCAERQLGQRDGRFRVTVGAESVLVEVRLVR
ncbi:MAG: hypothetical protein IT332_02925 [Ardenticatenales bacterium]|nr:hypothetical protein [Ardenticatenales bacterium]